MVSNYSSDDYLEKSSNYSDRLSDELSDISSQSEDYLYDEEEYDNYSENKYIGGSSEDGEMSGGSEDGEMSGGSEDGEMSGGSEDGEMSGGSEDGEMSEKELEGGNFIQNASISAVETVSDAAQHAADAITNIFKAVTNSNILIMKMRVKLKI
jgi:hypothetical protein